MKKNLKFIGFILIILSILIALLYIISKKYIKNERIENLNLYKQMVEIDDNKSLIGLSKEEVIELLGHPNNKYNEYNNAWRIQKVYSYKIGQVSKGLFWGDTTIFFDGYYSCDLRVRFDENDIVKATFIRYTP